LDEVNPSNNNPDKSRYTSEKSNPSIPLWEWILASIGLMLVVGSIGLMSYEAIAGDSSPPDIMVRVDAIHATREGYLVTIRVFNRGGSTAAGVMVKGTLKRDTESVEISEIIIDYMPSHSERNGGLFFSKDPQQFDLELRANGYQAP
jgi:uncharacterized protein (TIGR02588 family)